MYDNSKIIIDKKNIVLIAMVVVLCAICILVVINTFHNSLPQELATEYNKILGQYEIVGKVKVDKVGRSKLYVDTTIEIEDIDSLGQTEKYKLISDLYGVHQYAQLFITSDDVQYTAKAEGNRIVIKENGKEVHSFVSMNVFSAYVRLNNITTTSKEVLADPDNYFAVKFTIEGNAKIGNNSVVAFSKDKYILEVHDDLTSKDWYLECNKDEFALLKQTLEKQSSMDCKLVCSMNGKEYNTYRPYNVAKLHYICWDE